MRSAFKVAHLVSGVIPVKVNRQNELQSVSFCKHGSPVARSSDTTMKRTIMVHLKLQATRTAGEDEIGEMSLREK